jgi:hypothetical protein
MEIGRESTTSHYVDKSFWKRLWTWRKTDYGRNYSDLMLYIIRAIVLRT